MLTVFEIMRLSAETLRTDRASNEIWANFIWYQSWVLHWMAGQIDPAYQSDFLKGVVSAGRQCPRTGIVEFQSKFKDDQMAQRLVGLQLFGCTKTFVNLAKDKLSDRDRRLLAFTLQLKTFAPLFGRLFS
jgi:hypothetical protein